MMADILSTPSPGAENDGHQWIQSEKTRCLGKSGKRNGKLKTNCGYLSWGQALMFSTTSMTGSGGFTPGTPVSTHFKRLSKKHREIHHKRYKKNRLEKNSKLNGKLFLKIRK